MALETVGSNPIFHPTRTRSLTILGSVSQNIGLSPSGKATDFDSVTREFESRQPSHVAASPCGLLRLSFWRASSPASLRGALVKPSACEGPRNFPSQIANLSYCHYKKLFAAVAVKYNFISQGFPSLSLVNFQKVMMGFFNPISELSFLISYV